MRWRAGIEEGIVRWFEGARSAGHDERRAGESAARVLGAVSRLSDDCILTCDSGSCANWYARDIKIRLGIMEQGRAYLAALIHGDPQVVSLSRTSVKEWWATTFPDK